MTIENKTNWEERLERRFVSLAELIEMAGYIGTKNEIKLFVASELSLQRNRIIEEVDVIVANYKGDGLVGRREDMAELLGQQIIDKIKNI